ncbi:MAG: tRNA (adenosine(37)-N6)-threonylcarbamoyltransferase complex ATPase subunit type 1 TsaE [Bacillota bacterium]|nr:tRNA (adenosine(37)-N6)-threonylcarbamoyltransferase complex ATPase subunit type 1 TsaE [Bacillota bacterium]
METVGEAVVSPDTKGCRWAFEAETRSPGETRDLARAVGRAAGDGLVVLLSGPLGAGKTVFAQGLLEGLGVAGRVASPTFTLVNEYRARLPAWHIDLYRLDGEADFAAIGGDELLLGGLGVVVVEWAERLGDLVPAEHMRVSLALPEYGAAPGEARRLSVEVRGRGLKPVADAVARRLESMAGRCPA